MLKFVECQGTVHILDSSFFARMSRVGTKYKQIGTVYKGNIKSLIYVSHKKTRGKVRKSKILKEYIIYLTVNMFAKFYI